MALDRTMSKGLSVVVVEKDRKRALMIKLLGGVMHSDTADGNWFFGQFKDGTNITPMRETLIFDPAF